MSDSNGNASESNVLVIKSYNNYHFSNNDTERH